MRGPDVTREGLFVVRKTADYVPAGHPLLAMREILSTSKGCARYSGGISTFAFSHSRKPNRTGWRYTALRRK